jgi:nucleotide-binding universal stress UspA family protein
LAAKFIMHYGGSLHVLHVYDHHNHYPDDACLDVRNKESSLLLALEEMVKEFAGEVKNVRYSYREGDPTFHILDLCKQEQPRMLYMGIREGRQLHDIFIGTHTKHMLRDCPVPVVVVDLPPKEGPMDEVLVPFDYRKGIPGSIQFFKDLGRPLGRRALLIAAFGPEISEDEVFAEASKEGEAFQATGLDLVEIELVQDNSPSEALLLHIRQERSAIDVVLLEHIDYAEEGHLTAGSVIEEIVTRCRMPVVYLPKRD